MEQLHDQAKITRDLTIQEIFQLYPGKAQKLAQIMTSAGLHCIGCGASVFETIEEGVLGHGMSEEELDSLVKELNDEVQRTESVNDAVGITKHAAEKVKELSKKFKKEGWGIKVGLMKAGCSGYQYDIAFQEKAGKDDVAFESAGVNVFVDKHDLEKLNGSEIDWVDGLQGAGFKVNNPNVHHSCGCGSSVGF
ncbi:MAG TPA: iron-sulfur cluster assembly accessory protein [Candidatus Nanoarchaeia archaeon]|nr:iron-sulfur cluster assembly accessory protein [Candidatus Nanoarchaeia archaeon]